MQTCCVDTVESSFPNHRGRAYLVATRAVHRDHAIAIFPGFQRTFVHNVGAMRRTPPSCLDILFPADDPRIEKALKEWQERGPAALQGGPADGHMTAVQSKKRSPLLSSYARLRCRDSTLASPWLQPLNFRMRQVLAEQQEDTRSDHDITLYDISQSISRCPRSSALTPESGIICSPAMLPGSFLWMSMPEPGAAASTMTHPCVVSERFLLPDELLPL